jgi:hypothetical protein
MKHLFEKVSMGESVVDSEKRMPVSRSMEPPSSRSFLRRRRTPQKIRSFSPLNGDVVTSPAKSTTSRSRSFRLPKSLLRRTRSLNLSIEKCDSCNDDDGKKKSYSLSPVKRKRTLGVNFLRRTLSFVRNVSKGSKGSTGSITEESDEDRGRPLSMLESTRVVALSSPPSVTHKAAANYVREKALAFSCETAILGHSYLELCGTDNQSFEDSDDHLPRLPEDPTIQESVECIFASQLQDGLELWNDEDEVESISTENRSFELQSPSLLQQSRLNRLNRSPSLPAQNMRRYHQANLLYFGTYDPTVFIDEQKTQCESPLVCSCPQSDLPALNPEAWPQAPLLLRPTPGSGTRIKGVRFANEKKHLWEPGSGLNWPDVLASKWRKPCSGTPYYRCCEKCAILPINNGNEKSGESLVIDFETDEFEGSFLLRLRFSEGTTQEPYDDNEGYFHGVNRRYQAVVRGRFKKNIPLVELSTGFRCNRACGKLPAKWILRGGIKVLKFFAPQLDAKLEGDRPHSLTPLGSTPQSLSVETEETDFLDGPREEPTDGSRTLLGKTSLAESSLQRGKFRKKHFDKLFVQGSLEPKTDPSKIYTFEFLQHLFDFQEFSIELGSMLGSIHLEEILDGQPLQVMATHGDKPLWSFDIWHECLWEKAVLNARAGRR